MPFHRLSPALVLATLAACRTVRGTGPRLRSRAARRRAPAFVGVAGRASRGAPCSAAQRSYSADLTTAYEWLARERCESRPTRHRDMRWFDPRAPGASDDEEEIDEGMEVASMPLYPMGAVHIPYSGENCTIVNIEQKNVKMAMDLVNGTWNKNALFCASLRARDTNRVAAVGTLMRILDIDDRSISGATTWPGTVLPTLNRVVATCRAVGIADILSIEDRECAEDEYLRARVRIRPLPGAAPCEEGAAERGSMATQAIEDYQKVRSIYINSQSLASNELPKFARQAVKTLPIFDATAVTDETTFWQLVETWQMLCNTIRQAKQTQLQNVVNELSVTVAMRSKGPLELPVKRRNLPAEVQRQLEQMEQRAAQDFIDLGMEPILDFQEILAATERTERARTLARMMARERARLEAKESLIQAFLREELGEEALAASSAEEGPAVFD